MRNMQVERLERDAKWTQSYTEKLERVLLDILESDHELTLRFALEEAEIFMRAAGKPPQKAKAQT